VPIVALTAGVMRGDAARCFQAGMIDYLSKPVDFDMLRSKMFRYKKQGFNV
jgi:CheY-like chemotaxis protein